MAAENYNSVPRQMTIVEIFPNASRQRLVTDSRPGFVHVASALSRAIPRRSQSALVDLSRNQLVQADAGF